MLQYQHRSYLLCEWCPLEFLLNIENFSI